ncbi:MAG: glycosyltransferase [Chroococcus sp. CMT-3BRIN-NPC107]|jgi:glycosyltransferase involved in cell wall biosynthesis|nr:glycosyltransferase [Chroococcus sp. CMT-3BRIN-NPC107]
MPHSLVIAGNSIDDNLTDVIKQEIQEVSNIKFIPGFVPDDRIQVYMNACDAVIFPYQDILTSGAVLLAMSFGRACIALNKGCIGETLDDLGAFLYEPNDDKNLLTAINQAIQKQANLLTMGEHNRQKVEQWNWNYVAKKTLQVYES